MSDEVGANGITKPVSHTTRYGLEDDDSETLEDHRASVGTDHHHIVGLMDWVSSTGPISIHVSISNDPLALQREVVPATEYLGNAPTEYYEPHRWVPHIGYALALEWADTTDVVDFLVEYHGDWGSGSTPSRSRTDRRIHRWTNPSRESASRRGRYRSLPAPVFTLH